MKVRAKKKRRGSVLLTVVFVMSIMIIFLFGTMALAMAATNRSHVNYSSAQTGITARAVAESTIRAIGDGSTAGVAFAKSIGALSDTNRGPIKVPVNIQGDGTETLGRVSEVEVSYAGTKSYYTPEGSWETRDIIKFTAKVTMSGVESTSTIYTVRDFKDNGGGGGGGGGAGFVTTANANLSCQTSLFGGSYIKLPTLADAKKYVYTNSKQSHEDRVKDVFGGDVSKTNGFYTENSNAVIGADVYVNHNMYLQNWSGFVFPDKGSGITVWGNLFCDNNSISHLKYYYNGSGGDMDFKDAPYIYVDGVIKGDGPKLGEGKVDGTNFPLNVFCGSMEFNSPNDMFIAANVYCMDEDGESTIIAKNHTPLYSWAGSMKTDLRDNAVVKGDICSNNNLTVGKITVQGDLRVRNTLTVAEPITVEGNIVCDKIVGDTSKITCKGKIYTSSGSTSSTPNKIGTYLRWTPKVNEENKYVGPKNIVLNDGIFVDGEYVNKHDGYDAPASIMLYYTLTHQANEDIQATPGSVAQFKDIDYNIAPIYPWDDPCLIDGTEDKYYAETNAGGVADYTKRTKDENSSDASSDGIKTYLASIGETQIYPKYAERLVLLGKDPVVSTGNPETDKYKIVKTLEEVLANVANPYEYDFDLNNYNTLQGDRLKPILDGIKAIDSAYGVYGSAGWKALSTVAEIETQMGGAHVEQLFKDGTGYNRDATNNLIGDKEVKIVSGTGATKDAKSVLIKESCRVNFSGSSGFEGKAIVIDPGDNDIVIDVAGWNLDNVPVIVNDAGKGTVHIVIRDGVTFNHGNNHSTIMTQSYHNLLLKESAINYHSPKHTTDGFCLDPPADPKAVDPFPTRKPNIYIYGMAGKSGTSNAKLKLPHITLVTANIVSPNLEVEMNASFDVFGNQGYNIGDFYYENTNIRKVSTEPFKQGIIGCLNAREANLPNTLYVVYIDDDGNNKKKGSGFASDKDYTYYGLYYDEY